jgi:uncharacterized YkwD family protein
MNRPNFAESGGTNFWGAFYFFEIIRISSSIQARQLTSSAIRRRIHTDNVSLLSVFCFVLNKKHKEERKMKTKFLATTAAVIVLASLTLPATNSYAFTGSRNVITFGSIDSNTTVTAPTQQSEPVPAPQPVVSQPVVTQPATTQPTNTVTSPTQQTQTTQRTSSSNVITLVPMEQQTSNTSTQTQQPAPAPAPTQTQQPTTATIPTLTTGVNSSRLTQAQVNSMVMEMLQLVNNARIENGLKPLTLDTQVTQLAQMKSEDMVKNNYFAHTSPTYGTVSNMYRTYGVKYRSAGENLARSTSVKQAFTNLMNSAGHRRNILSTNYTHIGIGIDRHPNNVHSGRYVYTQMFLSK